MPRNRLTQQPSSRATVTPSPQPQLALEASIAQYLDLKALVDRLQVELGEVRDDLKAAAFKAKKKGQVCETDTHTVAYVESSHVSISKEALLEAGVKPSIIKKAEKVTPYAYPKVTEKKQSRVMKRGRT